KAAAKGVRRHTVDLAGSHAGDQLVRSPDDVYACLAHLVHSGGPIVDDGRDVALPRVVDARLVQKMLAVAAPEGVGVFSAEDGARPRARQYDDAGFPAEGPARLAVVLGEGLVVRLREEVESQARRSFGGGLGDPAVERHRV